MGNPAPSDLGALNAALDALNHVSVAIKIISEHLASIQRQAAMIELEFNRDGTFKLAFYRSDKKRQPLSEDYLVNIRSDCKWLPKRVESLWEAWAKADSAIANLPRRLVERLEALTNTPWVSAVRRNCLDNILKWPGELHHQTSYAAVKVSGTVEELLENARNADPFPTWKEYQRLLATYTHDLYAIRDAISPEKPQAIATIVANAEKLFPAGMLDDRNLVELVLKINTERSDGKRLIAIAREYFDETKGSDPKSRSALASLRRLRRDGRVNY